jgi:phosphatidylinositol 3-kinase
VYNDYDYKTEAVIEGDVTGNSISPTASSAPTAPNRNTPVPGVEGPAKKTLGFTMRVYDPEMNRDNPAESKHRRLVRSHRNGPLTKRDPQLLHNTRLNQRGERSAMEIQVLTSKG